MSNVHTYNIINKEHTYSAIINLLLKCNVKNTCHSHIMIKLQALHLQITI